MRDAKEKWWKRLWNRCVKGLDPNPGVWFFLGALWWSPVLLAFIDGRPIKPRILYIIEFGILGTAHIAVGIYFKIKYRRSKDDTDQKEP